jgi:hypothetical protein
MEVEMKIKASRFLVGLVILALLASTRPVQASHQEKLVPVAETETAGLQNLGALLNPDGTLNLPKGFSGSLGAAGWQMSTGPGGEPRFTRRGALSAQGNAISAAARQGNAPSAAGDELWDDQFVLGVYYSPQPGNSNVFAIAVSGTDVYVGGDFDRAGNVAASNIARWDTAAHKWFALGSGVTSRVLAIAARGDDVYVGGNFTAAGGKSAHNIAHWNEATHTWSALGDELTHTSTSPEVDAIAIADNGDVYVGGNFEKAGNLTLNNIGRWDGSSWHAMSSGTSGTFHDVLAIAITGSDVYIGGQFENAAGWHAHNVARWNGSAWSGLGGGTGGTYPDVCAIVISGTNVYIGGEFEEVTDATNGTQAVGHVAMWNGTVWSTMAGGLGDPDVYALALGSDGDLYAGGRFHTLADGSTTAQRLARWDGSAWHSVGGSSALTTDGVSSNVYALAFVDDQMFVGGFSEQSNDGRILNHIGYYDISDDEWYALGNSVNGEVHALAVDGEDVYIGGIFTSAGGVKTNGIARWNQRTGDWFSLRGGMGGCTGFLLGGCRTAVHAIYVDGSDIYVGGNFTQAGATDANSIARWNTGTKNWYSLGDGVTCSGMGCSASVRAISVTGNYVVVGGNFDYAGGSINQVNNITLWDGNNWGVLGNGTNGTVYAVEALSLDEIYIGGSFSSPAPYIAKWSGGWSSLNADTVNGAVYAIKQVGYQLWAGGAFTNLGGPNGDYVTTFHNNDWFQLSGDPLDGNVHAFHALKGYTFVGGEFTATGVLGMSRIGSYYGSPGEWSSYGSGADDTVYAIAPYTLATVTVNVFYIGGSFVNAGGKPSAYFGRNGGLYYTYLPTTTR